tara:strand:- start:5128 stop:6234 length:1107 start_codon:yes stop_codon:yes gene_type:complete
MKIGVYTGYVHLKIDGVNDEFPVINMKDDTVITYRDNQAYGSELSLVNLAKGLIKKDCEVVIFNSQHIGILDQLDFDVIIVSRYINFWMHFDTNIPVVIWLHDTVMVNWVQSSRMPIEGRFYIKNLYDKINRIVVLTDWHKQNIMNIYELDDKKFQIIGHGLPDRDYPNKIPKKVENKMIWTSDWERGVDRAVRIINKIEDPSIKINFDIYGEGSSDSRTLEKYPGLKEEIEKSRHNIRTHPYIDNDVLQEEWKNCDIWFYPTHYPETYCITALEAQRHGCFVLSTRVAALENVVEDRGIVCHCDPNHGDLEDTMAMQLEYYIKNKKKTTPYRKKGMEWAKQQTITKTVNEWYALLTKVMEETNEANK